jgi:GWxTD domain-containing protein
MISRLLITVLVISGLRLFAQDVVINTYPEKTSAYVMLPYDLFFFPAESTEADYQFSINVDDSNQKTVYQNVFHLKLDENTILRGSNQVVEFEINLHPGHYNAITQLRNIQFGDQKEKHFDLVVPDKDNEHVTNMIIAETEMQKFAPLTYSDLTKKLKSCYLILDTNIECDSIVLHTEINKSFQRTLIPLKSGYMFNLMPLLQKGEVTKLELSYYTNNLPDNIVNLFFKTLDSYGDVYSSSDQLMQIKYIASQNEWKVLKKIARMDELSAIEFFWNRHKYSSQNSKNALKELFHERVIQADKLFTLHKKMPGWKSDRGRIYITKGAPDDIVDNVFPLGRNSYILWYYFKENTVYRFVDKSGFGNYQLEEEYYEN